MNTNYLIIYYMASKKDIPSHMRNVNVVSAGEKWSEKILANPTLMLRAEKRTGKKGTIALHPLWNDEHPDHMKIKKAHEEYQKTNKKKQNYINQKKLYQLFLVLNLDIQKNGSLS